MGEPMLERVARAIAEHEGYAWEDVVSPQCLGQPEFFRGVARAALQAMREPTDAMYRASHSALIPAVVKEANAGRHAYIRGRQKVLLRWQAMIDAALANPSPTDRGGM